MKVTPLIYEIIKIICRAIKERKWLSFYYESQTSGKRWREIMPYMIILNEKENLEVVGVPKEELKITILDDRKKGHYLLEKLDINRFKILDKTFNDPGVPRRIVVVTQNPVVCRFIYDDEDPKEVMKSWIKISKKK